MLDDFLLALDKCDHNEESPVYIESQRQLLLTYNDFAVECFTKGFYDEAIILFKARYVYYLPSLMLDIYIVSLV
jgi:predicted GNAT family N-acyltransferase